MENTRTQNKETSSILVGFLICSVVQPPIKTICSDTIFGFDSQFDNITYKTGFMFLSKSRLLAEVVFTET